MTTQALRVAVLTVSDRCFEGQTIDRGGPAVAEMARGRGWDVRETALVQDDEAGIARQLKAWCVESSAINLILTTGGTGVGPRDVTPEATRAIIEKEIPGLAERMRREGERFTLRAVLSRGICGLRGQTIIVNLPGSSKGAQESLQSIAELLEHACAVLSGEDHALVPEI